MNEPDLAAQVRRADPDRFLGAIFAPPQSRRWLFVLYAFNHELARAREVASQPPLALIRLQWWREVVEGADRAHPLAVELRAGLAQGIFSDAALTALIDAREAEAEPIPDRAAFLDYARGTAGGAGADCRHGARRDRVRRTRGAGGPRHRLWHCRHSPRRPRA
ncbi:squalene/phytoene synthase family protein [Acidiphilium multivorum]|uniref:squalene/phytoene synthase family protein n=1 Tax=Acidiphilium multivorum TaxID=62140 RepID=UPI002016977A|nr:squalene/phytoene synthase family protein [Acidiphilium multivorum]